MSMHGTGPSIRCRQEHARHSWSITKGLSISREPASKWKISVAVIPMATCGFISRRRMYWRRETPSGMGFTRISIMKMAAVSTVQSNGPTRLSLARPTTPRHGAVGTRTELIEFRDMLVTVRNNVAALKQQGKSLDEIIAAKPTAAFDARWGNFVFNGDQFTKMVYAGLQSKN